jgi:hypothetical protein
MHAGSFFWRALIRKHVDLHAEPAPHDLVMAEGVRAGDHALDLIRPARHDTHRVQVTQVAPAIALARLAQVHVVVPRHVRDQVVVNGVELRLRERYLSETH